MSICQHLVTKDVVVVTIQYRLGFLGFWTTGDSSIPDNVALHDMVFALKWVKENIGLFNGDPNNITLMGQSAGGASVDFLSISPVSRGGRLDLCPEKTWCIGVCKCGRSAPCLVIFRNRKVCA